jgi:hypothetical protein
MIVAALFLFVILLALGMGLMSAQSSRMKAARAQGQAIQAKALALAAWDDVRVKLGKDLFFPPATRGQEFFSYSEDVYDKDDVFFGTYSVTIDTRYQRLGRTGNGSTASQVNVYDGFYIITCIGKVGGRDQEPSAERALRFEVDMRNFSVIRAEDRGSL